MHKLKSMFSGSFSHETCGIGDGRMTILEKIVPLEHLKDTT